MIEDEIISLFQPVEGGEHPLDDCAIIPAPESGEELLVTTDSMTENTHFRLAWTTPEFLAEKLFQINLSDLAVSGGVPRFALLNLGLPPATPADFIRSFAVAFRQQLSKYDCRLIGGDTFRSGHLEFTLTLGGSTARHLKREGGRAGDALYLTGSVGLALAGYRHLAGVRVLPDSLTLSPDSVTLVEATPSIGAAGTEATLRETAVLKHLRPQARFEWARWLAADNRIHAGLDVSDGVEQDALRLARASRLTLEVFLERIPIIEELGEYLTVEEAVSSGEEYEVLFLAEPGITFPFPCHEIGRCRPAERGCSLKFFNAGRPIQIDPEGYRHFIE